MAHVLLEAGSMWNIRRILVPLDLGAASLLALERAFDVAERFESSLRLLLVLPTTIDVRPRGFLTYAEATAALSAVDQERLARVIDVGRHPSVDVQIGLREGVAAKEILAAAQETEADLIVMGTHGRRGLSRALMGSIAEEVTVAARVPVLVVHAEPAHGAPSVR